MFEFSLLQVCALVATAAAVGWLARGLLARRNIARDSARGDAAYASGCLAGELAAVAGESCFSCGAWGPAGSLCPHCGMNVAEAVCPNCGSSLEGVTGCCPACFREGFEDAIAEIDDADRKACRQCGCLFPAASLSFDQLCEHCLTECPF